MPNYENSNPQTGLNNPHFIANILGEIYGIKQPVYIANAWFDPSIPAPPFRIPEENKMQLPNYEGITLLPADESDVTSLLGTPVFGDITFESGTYNIYNKYTGAIESERRESYTLPYSCIVDFSRQNNVITTPVLGGTGTVKEIYGIGDWDINIRGIAFNNDKSGNPAQEQINQLIRWADLCDSIEVSGSVFLGKRINRIVIKSIDIQPIEAKWNVIPFTIQAISDEPIELTL